MPTNRDITEVFYEAGNQSQSTFYADADESLGMTPTNFRKSCADTSMQFAVGACFLGAILVAATDRGVCAVLLGDDPEALMRELQDRFPHADLQGAVENFDQTVSVVIAFVETPHDGFCLPLDIQGTAFQQRIWAALRQIPTGTTVTYRDIAERIGSPKAVRAVAHACATNVLAVVIPCHRVIRTDGSLAGYRWGLDRKNALLEFERQPVTHE
jgi:AraC family transcriptional regulator of adaptative response/methylated-DNA-[protein]-cysteine methyltransferase